jgi:hypothetical protein
VKPVLAPFAALALLLSALVPSPAPALEPSKASDLVTLVAFITGTCPVAGFPFVTRILADGTPVPFTIPPKRVLVITGFEFTRSDATPGTTATALLSQQAPGEVAALLQADGVADASGSVAGSAFAAPGVAVRGGDKTLCIAGASAAVLRGFLAKDK